MLYGSAYNMPKRSRLNHNQTKLGVCVGIVTEVGITKIERTVGNNKYINYPIVYRSEEHTSELQSR